ncbi:uncharacterized protein LOC111296772 isoform X2 [Durio zibethinus]|uniref:Uncharacterized protein LOC111296772 isoform X2 n=1 Tax=Durio zibethinus TaxID=66656 RepID=A0A6P5Z2W8_DURZI|nr:uncharacterized protein LOC111296772 isoform X2 [Durio zibethinus]
MKSLSSVGLGLSIVFGCLLLALVAELYYLLWWKNRLTSRNLDNGYSNPARDFFVMFCWKRSSSMAHSALNPQEQQSHLHHLNSNKDLLLKPFGHHHHQDDHGVSGPPRFLFTIVEETTEDLEAESRVGSRGRSLSDILVTVETPFLTPLSSPPFFTPPLTPMDACYSHHGFNPLFESATDAEFNRIRSSPPPKFRFLQEAEQKLHMERLMEEDHSNDGLDQENGDMTPSKHLKDEEDGSFITIIVDGNNEGGFNHNHQQQSHSSTTSQTKADPNHEVLPLSSSPSTFMSPARAIPI